MTVAPRRTSRLLPILTVAYALCGCGSGGGSFNLVPPSYTVGGTINGLVGSGLTLTRNGSTVGRGANGTYPDLGLGSFGAGQAYDVTVITQPTSPSQTCVVANGKGTIGNASVTNVQVTCTTNPSRFVYVANGSPDSIWTYTIDATSGALTAGTNLSLPAGAPHVISIDPQSAYLYMVNGGSNNISAYAIDVGNGALTVVGGSPFPTGTNPSSVSIHPSGALVYVTNQSDATISAYSQDAASGTLTAVAGSPFATGNNPVSVTAPFFANPLLDNFLYVCGGSTSILGYTIAFKGTSPTGALQPLAGAPFTAAGSGPSSLMVDNLGKFLYVANSGSNNISAYAIDATTGALTPISGSPFASGGGPTSIAVSN